MAKTGVTIYTKYPLPSIVLYNGTTIIHFLLGGAGMMAGYSSLAGYIFGSAYLVFAGIEMYLLMPVKVCRNCVYYKLDSSLCVSGLNLLSRRLAKPGSLTNFQDRAKGVFCPNNLYLASLIIPIVAVIPALVIAFSFLTLAILVILLALLLFRFFVLFRRVACPHCRAKNICPNAKAMGLSGN